MWKKPSNFDKSSKFGVWAVSQIVFGFIAERCFDIWQDKGTYDKCWRVYQNQQRRVHYIQNPQPFWHGCLLGVVWLQFCCCCLKQVCYSQLYGAGFRLHTFRAVHFISLLDFEMKEWMNWDCETIVFCLALSPGPLLVGHQVEIEQSQCCDFWSTSLVSSSSSRDVGYQLLAYHRKEAKNMRIRSCIF